MAAMTRLIIIALLLMLPLQWASAALERYQPHPAEVAGVVAGDQMVDSDQHAPGEHDCPECHVLCLKGIFSFKLNLPSLQAEALPERSPPRPLASLPYSPERPPRLNA